MNQHQTTIQHIQLYMSKLKTAENESLRRDYMHKVLGMLSLANLLEIISIEEYETYFDEVFK